MLCVGYTTSCHLSSDGMFCIWKTETAMGGLLEERLGKRGREMETKRNKCRELEMDDSPIIAPVITNYTFKSRENYRTASSVEM